jgi:raffinose/stachyose/melibiose transport system substrate-binding protein
MKKMKKIATLAMSTLMLASALTACGGGGEDASGDAGTKTEANANNSEGGGEAKNEEIRVFTFFTGSDVWAPIWSEVTKEYMEANPHITIVDESQPTAGANDLFRTKMNADIAAKTPADLCLFYSGADTKIIADSGLFVDLTEYLEADPEWKGNFNWSAVESQKYEGVQYCIPFLGYYEGLFYNKALFDQYGLEEPTSWDNILACMETFNANGIVPIATSLAKPSYLIEEFILAYGGEEDHKNYFSDSWAPALDAVKTLYDMKAFPADAMSISDDDVRMMVKDGKAAMMLNGSWCVSALEENPDMRIITMPTLPEGKGGESCVLAGFGSGWSITKEAMERSDETLKFLKWLTSPEIMTRFIEYGGSAAVKCDAPEGSSELMKSAVEMLNKATYTDTAIDSQVSREAWMAITEDGIPYLVAGEKTGLDLLAEARKIEENINR